jgi:hypothetical protein
MKKLWWKKRFYLDQLLRAKRSADLIVQDDVQQ